MRIDSIFYLVPQSYTMRIARGLCLFYWKLVVASLLFSLFLAVLGSGSVPFFIGTGFAFIFLTPVFHYLSYEVNSPGEYYFYYNLGLSRLVLWVSTLIMSILVGLSIMFL